MMRGCSEGGGSPFHLFLRNLWEVPRAKGFCRTRPNTLLYCSVFCLYFDFLSPFFLFFFFSTCPRKRGKGIRISDLHFIKRDTNQLNYLLRTLFKSYYDGVWYNNLKNMLKMIKIYQN
jgi:hypothetical protein